MRDKDGGDANLLHNLTQAAPAERHRQPGATVQEGSAPGKTARQPQASCAGHAPPVQRSWPPRVHPAWPTGPTTRKPQPSLLAPSLWLLQAGSSNQTAPGRWANPPPSPQRLANKRVQRPKGLIQQHQPRVARQRAGHRHALLLAARQLQGGWKGRGDPEGLKPRLTRLLLGAQELLTGGGPSDRTGRGGGHACVGQARARLRISCSATIAHMPWAAAASCGTGMAPEQRAWQDAPAAGSGPPDQSGPSAAAAPQPCSRAGCIGPQWQRGRLAKCFVHKCVGRSPPVPHEPGTVQLREAQGRQACGAQGPHLASRSIPILRMRGPNVMLSATVMCLNSA